MLIAPRRCLSVELGQSRAVALLQANLEEVGEEPVVSIPAALVVKSEQEEVRALDALQHLLTVGPARDRVTEGPAQTFENRGLEQEAPDLVWLPLQHLLGQVVKDVAVAACEARDDPNGVGRRAQRQRRELETGRPAFGPLHQGGHDLLRELETPRSAQELD